MNRDIIPEIKRSIVGVGLTRKDNFKMEGVFGTGFMIDKTGIFITAKHVIEACKIAKEFFLKNKIIETEIAVFRPIHDSAGLSVDTGIVKEIKYIHHSKKGEYLPLFDMDLAFGILKTPYQDLKALPIKEPQPLKLLDEIAICGYPAGQHSLDPSGEFSGQRFSPIFQTGRIGGFLAFDEAPLPYGIQTDIIGVGGSSGSPLIDPNDGSVVGMAQKVLPADVEVKINDFENEKELRGYGMAKVGQIYGISNHILFPITLAIRKEIEKKSIENIPIKVTGLTLNYLIQGS